MAKIPTNISIDAETKAKAQALLAEFGMDLSTAINIFLKQMLFEGAFPIAITRKTPNKLTIKAMEESEKMARHPEKYKKYNSVDSMMEDILGDV